MAEATHHTAVADSAAGASKKHLVVWNGSGSGVTLKVQKITAAPSPTAAVTGLVIPLRVHKITAAPTGGSAVSPAWLKAAAGDNAMPAQVTVTAGATGGATESGPAFGFGTCSGEETQGGAGAVIYDYEIDGSKPVEIAQNEGFVIRQNALPSAGGVSVAVVVTTV
jgi:hypothetical protein